jgi:hypothetical protein
MNLGADDTSDTPVASKKTGDAAPVAEPASKGTGTVKVRTSWPQGDFIIEDVPTITRDGVELTSDQFATVEKMAKMCGVTLHIDEEVA